MTKPGPATDIQRSPYRTAFGFALAFLCVLVLFPILVDLAGTLDATVFYVFQTRDLARANELAAGWPIFFGPEMTGGGNLPGPAYYFILAASQLIWSTWQSAWFEMMALATMATATVTLYLRNKDLELAGLAWIVLFALAPNTRHVLALFINPSYNFLFNAIALVLICNAFGLARSPAARERSFALAGLTIGIGDQIHFSIVFYLFAMLFMQAFAPRLGLDRVSRRGFWLGVMLFILPAIPYVVWLTLQHLGIEKGQPGVYVGQPNSVLPTLAHLLKAVPEVDGIYFLATVAGRTAQVVPAALPVLLMVMRIPRGDTTNNNALRILKPLVVCAAFSAIPFVYVYFVPIANRYGVPLNLTLTTLTAVLVTSHLGTGRRLYAFNALASVLALILLAYLLLKDHPRLSDVVSMPLRGIVLALLLWWAIASIRKLPALRATTLSFILTCILGVLQLCFFGTGELFPGTRNMPRWRDWRYIWTQVYQRTNWPLEEMRRRVYFISTHIDADPEPSFNSVVESLPHAPPSASRVPDGYFIATNVPLDRNFLDWMMDEPIDDDVRAAIRSQQIVLGPSPKRRIAIVPYWVVRRGPVPRPFHNWALAYRVGEDHRAVKGIREPEGVRKLSADQYLFFWNECPDHHPYCATGAIVNVKEEKSADTAVKVQVLGEPLAQVSPWIHPTWTQSWNEPYVAVACGGQEHRMPMATSIGFSRRYLVYDPVSLYFIANNSLIAPFERTFHVNCRGPVTAISVGRSSSSIESIRSTHEIPGKHLTVNL